jgi:hypothetical protein
MGCLGNKNNSKARACHCTGVKVTCIQGDWMTTRLKSFLPCALGLLQLAIILPAIWNACSGSAEFIPAFTLDSCYFKSSLG